MPRARPAAPLGRPTRGTTNPNRLRRADRWLVTTRAGTLLRPGSPLVVDLGFGRHPATVVEFAARLARVRPGIDVVGVEIDPARVATARAVAGGLAGVRFMTGGFELAGLAGARVDVLRAFNVLRQYEPDEVLPAWEAMRGHLSPGGIALDGTCDEIGRLASWVVLEPQGPTSLVLAWRLAGLERPGAVAARLPKILIGCNRPPYRIHALLADLDAAWRHTAALGVFGARQRFAESCRLVRDAGWPLLHERQWRHGTVEVAWPAVAPQA